MLERKESSVTIFRGDDTGGQLGKTIVINFHCGDTVNMEGVVVTFILGGFYEKEFRNVHDGDRLEIFMTHEQTAMLPLGVSFGKLYGTDASGKIRTFSNRIPIRVTNHVCEAYGDSEESEIDVTISNAITWDSIFGKPETFPPSEHRHQKSDIDNLESDLKTLSDGVESAIEAAEAAKTEAAKGVRTVNGKTGAVSLGANDVGAYTKSETDATVARIDADIEKVSSASAAALTKANELDAAKADKSALTAHVENTNNPHGVTAAQVGAVSISPSPTSDETFDWSPSGVDGYIRLFGTFYKTGIGLGFWSGGGSLFNYHDDTADIYQFQTGKSGDLALTSDIEAAVKDKVGSFAPVGGASATIENGVAKLSDFFTASNSLLNGRLAYSHNATGLKDRAFNTLSFDGTEFNLSTALEAVTPTASGQPRDLLIVATATAATTISFTAGTIKGDKPTIDGAGTWLITLTEYASGVWYCRQIKMEDAA